MSRRWVMLAVAVQLLVLAWMAGEREWIFRTGHVVYLRTAPVDPRDLFRGDFVRLLYEVNTVQREDAPAPAARKADVPRHEVVYTRLQPAGEGLYEAAGASATQPSRGLFLRGRTEDSWRVAPRASGGVYVKYGIEQLFVEQGSGEAIERRRGIRNGLQVPMEIEVAVAASGKAVIRGYRWSRLGMKLEVLRRPAQRVRGAPPPEGPLSPKLRVTLANASDAPLAIADTDKYCSFHLVSVTWARSSHPPASQDCSAALSAARTITLAPGETHSVELDLTEPRWHVLDGGNAVEMGALRTLAQYRIEYRTPQGALAADQTLWRGRLASPSFNANGIID